MDDQKDPHSALEKYDSGHRYGHAFDANDLKKSENSAAGAGVSADKSDDVQNREGKADGYVNNFTGNNSKKKSGSKRFTIRSTKKKSATIVITGLLLGLLGFGGLGSLPFGVLSAFENLNFDLDDATPSLDKRMTFFEKKKFSFLKTDDAGTLGCKSGLMPMKCKFNTMSKKMVERYKAAGIDVTGETGGVYGDRVKVTKACFGGDCWEDSSAFFKAVNERGSRFKAGSLYNAHKRATNWRFLGVNGDSFVNKTLKRFGVTRTPPVLEGTPQERVNQLLTRAGTGNINDVRFVEAKDSEGNTIMDPKDPSKPLYVQEGVGGPVSLLTTDANGNPVYVHDGDSSKPATVFNETAKSKIEGTIKRVKVASHPITSKALKGINILGGIDVTCSAINTLGSASVAAKVSYAEQLVQFAVPYATMAFAQKNSTLSPEDVEALGETFFATDSRKTIQGYSGESESSVKTIEIPNPDYGKNALDSEMFKASINGGVPHPSLQEKNYSLGFGMTSTISSVLSIARIANQVVDFGNIGGINACSIASNGAVRLAGVVVGGIAAIFSGGATLALNVSVVLTIGVLTYFAEQYLHAALANNLIGEDLLESTTGRGAAIWTGMASAHSTAAQSRGMVPATADQIVAYQTERNQYKQEYIAFERQESNFFDVTNPYSVTGTFASTLQQYIPYKLTGSAAFSLPSKLPSFVFGGLASILRPYNASAASLDPERYKQCDDASYREIGLDADVQCNVRFYMPDEVLEMDPIEVAQWMEAEGYVEKDTTTGLPKGYTMIDPAKNQSLARQIIMGSVGSIVNTRKYGDVNDGYKDTYGKFLDFCVYRTLPFGETYDDNQHALGAAEQEWQNGSKCMETSGNDTEMLNYFRAYTFDKSMNDDLDESPILDNISCGPGTGSSSTSSSNNSADVAKIDAAIKKSQENNPKNPHPLDGKGQQIVDIANKYGVNARFIATTLLAETQFGTDGAAGPVHNNFGYNKLNDANECEAFTLNGDKYNCYNSAEKGIEGIMKNLTSNTRYKEETGPNGAAAGTVAAVRNIYCPEGDGDCNLDKFLKMSETIDLPLKKDDPVFTSSSTSSGSSFGGSVSSGSGTKMSTTEFNQLFSKYGLPTPTADGEGGYNELLEKLKSNPSAGWGAQQMLNGERLFKSKGGDIKEYLTTSWVWFETGAWPDPYEVNCMSNSSHPTNKVCEIGEGPDKVQVAGYQAWDVRHKLAEVYKQLYSESDLQSIMGNVIKNSSNASIDEWKYSDSDLSKIEGVTLASVYPSSGVENSQFNNPDMQFLSFMLGKDPAMAAALNSFAVTDDDVVAMLKDCTSLSWSNTSYYCDPGLRQKVANIMMALYTFDGGSSTGGICAPGSGSSGSALPGWTVGKDESSPMGYKPGGVSEPQMTLKHSMLDNGSKAFGVSQLHGPGNSQFAIDHKDGMYKNYDFPSYGFSSVGHPGYDISMPLGTKLYAPVNGIVATSGASGFFYHTEATANTSNMGELKIVLSNGDELILGHMQKIVVNVGDTVSPGMYVGESGYVAGPHLHLEYRQKDSSGKCSSGFCIVDPTHVIP